jgi:hypothetical protein
MMSGATYFGANRPARGALGLAAVLLFGCSATSEAPGSSDGLGGAGSTLSSSSASANGPGGGLNPSGGGGDDVCKKIDFLFVVDNSASMGAHQTSLVNSFGPFVDAIFSNVSAQDYQIMVIDSDADEDLHACEPCPWDSSWCGKYCDIQSSLGPCERTLGAGEIQPYTNQASNMDCGVPGGKRYITSALTHAEIKDKFACMAKVGIFGSGAERPMSAMVEALTSQLAPGACNEGFLRDDAVLVVTVITDDYPVASTADDSSTVGTVSAWYDAIVAAKKGQPKNVVMLGILNLASSTCVQEGSAGQGPVVHPTQKFVDLVDLFGSRGITGDICSQPDYGAFFTQAVALVDTACDEFIPPPK